jgi:NAD(P)-dependent dehydrogenase (short-subunit alcohol dehydrogenase family)
VGGVDCEVSSPASVQRLADAAVSQMGAIDVWINNAGYSGTYQVCSRGYTTTLTPILYTPLLPLLFDWPKITHPGLQRGAHRQIQVDTVRGIP